jgi:hypothetical protein
MAEREMDHTFARLPGGGYLLDLTREAVRLEIRHLRRERQQLVGELNVRCDWAGARTSYGSLACTDINLSSLTTRRAIAKHCADRARTKPDDFDWQWPIDTLAQLTIEAERTGDEPIVLDDAPELVVREHNVHGITIAGDAPTLLVAHGDSTKSLIELLALGSLAKRGHPTLYCDWEWTAERHKARKVRLFGPERLDGLHYLRLTAPLTVEADRIRRFCDEHGIEQIGIDSVGLACDGKLIDDDVAIRFYRALSTLPPAIVAAHVPKSNVADPKAETTAFGSVFFSNLARIGWAVRKQTTDNPDEVIVGCFPSLKQNDGARLRPVGLRFTFSEARIDVEPADLAAVDGLAERLPMTTRIAGVLKTGAFTVAELAASLDAKPDTVEKTLRRGEGTKFVRVTDKAPGSVYRWGLMDRRAA